MDAHDEDDDDENDTINYQCVSDVLLISYCFSPHITPLSIVYSNRYYNTPTIAIEICQEEEEQEE